MRSEFILRPIRVRPITLMAVILTAALVASAVRVSAAPSDHSAAVEYLRTPGSKAPFSPAVRVENILYLSGQIGAKPDGNLPADFGEQARQAMTNVDQTLHRVGSSFHDVFKCTVMLTDMSRWEEFNRIYVTYFEPARLPARSAIGANGLARGAMLELECLAYAPVRPEKN